MATSWRICAKRGCPEITDQRLCQAHRAEADRARGTKRQRGYGKEFLAQRRVWVGMVATGEVNCWRCLKPILPGAPFDLGHDDKDRSIIRGPEHPACNRSAAGKAAHQ
jgi:hypothetical protein